MIKHFNYTKKDGSVTERLVYQLSPPSLMLFGLDLTEFDEAEQKDMIARMQLLDADYKEAIMDLGLDKQYRFFKECGIDEL